MSSAASFFGCSALGWCWSSCSRISIGSSCGSFYDAESVSLNWSGVGCRWRRLNSGLRRKKCKL